MPISQADGPVLLRFTGEYIFTVAASDVASKAIQVNWCNIGLDTAYVKYLGSTPDYSQFVNIWNRIWVVGLELEITVTAP